MKDKLLETYRDFYYLYLKICTRDAEKSKDCSEEELRCSIRFCNNKRDELRGMVSLLYGAGIIDSGARSVEMGRILDTFSSIKLFHAFVEEGEVMVFVNRS